MGIVGNILLKISLTKKKVKRKHNKSPGLATLLISISHPEAIQIVQARSSKLPLSLLLRLQSIRKRATAGVELRRLDPGKEYDKFL